MSPDVVATTKHEEWTTSKKVVNHKTKQVETRVQRQIVLEDGKVVADSGPQVTTKTTEDNKVEETENTDHKKTGDDPPDESYIAIPGSARVVNEKTETHHTMKESKEENMQLHDENLRELSGPDIHRKSLVLSTGESPFYSISLDSGKPLPGKLTHFSSKSQKITDKEEVKEVSETKNGEMTTNTTRTHHHEEVHDDEVPEDEANVGALPEPLSRVPRRITYLKDDDELDSLSDKIRKEKEMNIRREIENSRRDAVTRKALSIEEEEEIRNSETNRWLEDHFGSDESDVVETTRTKAGGNVINIQMSSSAKKPPQVPKMDREVPVHRHSVSQFVNKINSMNEETEVKSSRTQPLNSRFGTRDSDVVYTTLRSPTPNSQPSRYRESPVTSPDNYSTLSSTKSPMKTYYLGQEGTYKAGTSPQKYESPPLRRQSAPWKSTPTLNEDKTFKKLSLDNHYRRDEISRERLARSPVQRSMSQRDISPRQQMRGRVSTQDDTIIHKFSSNDYFNEDDNPWLSSKTLPRGTKFTNKTKNGDHTARHKTSFSEVQTFNRGSKTDRSIQVELSDDDDAMTRSTLSRIRSPSPGDVEFLTIGKSNLRREAYSPVSTPTKPSKHFYFGGGSKTDYRKSYVRTNGSYSDGYGSLTSSKDRYPEKDDSIDHRIATFNTYGRSSDRSFDGSNIHSLERQEYSKNNQRYSDGVTEEVRHYQTSESRKNSKNSVDNRSSLHVDCDFDRGYQSWNGHNKTDSHDRRHFIDTLLTEADGSGYAKRTTPERRQRQVYTNRPPSPPNSSPSSNSPPPRLIRADRYGGSSSLSPPDSPVVPPPPPPPPPISGLYSSTGGTWSRSQGKGVRSPSPIMNPPNFKPLLSPVEIKNMANAFSRRSRDEELNHKYMEAKPSSKGGTVVVEVRDWGNR